ncbi:hypothetical protein ACLOJK_015056 [Asimina triloba]
MASGRNGSHPEQETDYGSAWEFMALLLPRQQEGPSADVEATAPVSISMHDGALHLASARPMQVNVSNAKCMHARRKIRLHLAALLDTASDGDRIGGPSSLVDQGLESNDRKDKVQTTLERRSEGTKLIVVWIKQLQMVLVRKL